MEYTPLINSSQRIGTAAELLVAYRFLEAGRLPAWPLVVCSYDLLVDAGDACYRIQVKAAAKRLVGSAYQWGARTGKAKGALTPRNSYDYLCIVTDPSLVYVIPTRVLLCAHDPTRLVKRVVIHEHGKRFSPFLNRFDLGPGAVPAPAGQVGALPPSRRTQWKTQNYREGRKEHRRLSAADVAAIRQLPIAFYRQDAAPGLLPIHEVARQFGVHVATLRNLLRGKRQDLRGELEG